MKPLLQIDIRTIYYIETLSCASFLITDSEASGILINTPAFNTTLLQEINILSPIKYIFLPSHLGALDLAQWQSHSKAQIICSYEEQSLLPVPPDIIPDNKTRFTRTIEFLPMSGRTKGTLALRLRNNPPVVFFGPALSHGEDGWPRFELQDDDYSQENRLFGALGMQDLAFEYAFCDNYRLEFGAQPGADQHLRRHLKEVL